MRPMPIKLAVGALTPPAAAAAFLFACLPACSGYGYGAGIRVDSPLGPIRLEYGWNQQRRGRLHVALGYD
jgi:hypothetical protein